MNGVNGAGGGGTGGHPRSSRRSRAHSHPHAHHGGLSTPTATPGAHHRAHGSHGGSGRSHGGSGGGFILDKNERLLRLNVGGHPFDVVRTSLPLLETMMTDRWLSSCLVDADGRIFIDRDGDAFGDILRYLRGGDDFLLGLVRASSCSAGGGGYGAGGACGPGNAAWRGGPSSSQGAAPRDSVDRLRRLRTEADYYGLHRLVRDIDVVTIGRRIVFESVGWARVAAGCLPRNRTGGNRQQLANANGNGGVFGAPNDANDDRGQAGNANNQNQQEEDQEEGDNPNNEEDQAMGENDDDNDDNNENENDDDNDDDNGENNDEDDAEDAEEAEDADDADDADDVDDAEEDEQEQEQEQAVFADEEEEEEGDDPNQPLPYKRWSWSKQYGNPEILRPHPTHTSSMVVGQDGTYLMLLRLAAALPSPLARIKWDQEEEQERRVTRGALRRRTRRRLADDDGSGGEEEDGGANRGRSKELEEDYFVTVNIEAPLQTVMDSVDESQTHFPLLRAGLWDYRTEEEVASDDPVFATFCAMECVSLRAGDILSVSFMNEEVSRARAPFPDDMPPGLANSLTLVRAHGNTLKRYERLKGSPTMGSGLESRRRGRRDSGSAVPASPSSRKAQRHRRRTDPTSSNDDDEDPTDHSNDISDEAEVLEEFDRALTRTAHWISPRNDFLPTPFSPPLRDHSSVIEFPHPGHYLLLGRVALGCRRDATFHSVLSGGPIEGHRAQMSVRSAGGRLLHAVGFVFEDKPRLEWADLSILSENAMFNDVVHVPAGGTELSITATGDCRLHPEGTEVGPFCSAVSQSLSCLLLDDEIMEVDRYMVGTVRHPDLGRREVKWFHTRSASAPFGRGKGGTLANPSLFDIDGHRLVWRGCLNSNIDFHHAMNNEGDGGGSDGNGDGRPTATVLIMGSIPPLHRGYVVGLLKNNDPISISITPESLDMKGRHCHYFQEVVELSEGDEITIAECGYGGEEGQSWREQLHIENRLVELDTRMGHLCFVVLQQSSDGDDDGAKGGEGMVIN